MEAVDRKRRVSTFNDAELPVAGEKSPSLKGVRVDFYSKRTPLVRAVSLGKGMQNPLDISTSLYLDACELCPRSSDCQRDSLSTDELLVSSQAMRRDS